jgi:hypothetical protein
MKQNLLKPTILDTSEGSNVISTWIYTGELVLHCTKLDFIKDTSFLREKVMLLSEKELKKRFKALKKLLFHELFAQAIT